MSLCAIRSRQLSVCFSRERLSPRLVVMLPYVPESLPVATLDFGRLIRLIGPANAALARYDGLLQSVVNPSVMLSPLTNQEAVLSLKIEGTQATVDEVLEYEAGIEFDPEKVHDIQEIVNYRSALTLAKETLAQRPLNLGGSGRCTGR